MNRGDRVRLTARGRKVNHAVHHARLGTVVGLGRGRPNVYVRWDGNKSASWLHVLNVEPALETDAHCVVCYCTDSHACDGGCSWAMVDRHERRGVCSSCVGKALAKLDRAR